jgi:hypothetical protein
MFYVETNGALTEVVMQIGIMDPVVLRVKRIQDKKRKIWSKPKNRWTALAHFRVVFGFLILSRSLYKFEI